MPPSKRDDVSADDGDGSSARAHNGIARRYNIIFLHTRAFVIITMIIIRLIYTDETNIKKKKNEIERDATRSYKSTTCIRLLETRFYTR